MSWWSDCRVLFGFVLRADKDDPRNHKKSHQQNQFRFVSFRGSFCRAWNPVTFGDHSLSGYCP
jgi:hypothetical protein